MLVGATIEVAARIIRKLINTAQKDVDTKSVALEQCLGVR